MKKLRIILLFKILLLIICIIYVCLYINNNKSKYKIDENEITGIITQIKYKNNRTDLIVKAKENVLVRIYNHIDFKIGDKVKVYGKLELPNENSNFHTFNYKKYLLSKKIYYIMNAIKIEKLKSNSKWYYTLKQSIIDKIDNTNNSDYLRAFLIGDNSNLDTTSYMENGISHLFAISGMHITFITMICEFLLNKISKKNKITSSIISIFLIFYMFLTSFSVSVVRASLMYILVKLNKYLKLNLTNIELIIFILSLLLFINPYYIYSVSFHFSFTVSIYLIVFSNLINRQKNYITKLFMTSVIAFIVSFPISINNFHSVNFFSIILNLIFVPFFTIIIFPLTIISFLLPFTTFMFNFFLNIFNNLSLFFSNINFFKFSFAHINIYCYIGYYLLISGVLYMIYKKNYYYIVILVITLLIHYNIRYFDNNIYITMFNVGQGDSLLVSLENSNILIDTGGIANSDYSIAVNIIISYLKSLGIHKLDYLILTHGDYDHMGEAINLVNNFKVEKVIFNCGPYNDLESELIKVLDKKKIPYYSCIKELNIDNNKLNFLQTKEYDNENDNSNVIYTELNGYKFMFMGDASSTTEKDILNKYNLPNIDVLKVGHHGSKTSSSKEFLNEINPKYSIISVGKNNRYGHPNKEVLENLKDSKMYRTDEDGSIMFKIKNNKLRIDTCCS